MFVMVVELLTTYYYASTTVKITLTFEDIMCNDHSRLFLLQILNSMGKRGKLVLLQSLKIACH